MTGPYADRLDAARDYTELFSIAKEIVQARLGRSRAGIMLGLARLGLSPNGFMGGYFVVGSNAIVLNRDVLDYVRVNSPEHHNAYAFHVLLHEYLHTLGWFSEGDVRPMAHELSVEALGEQHPATRIAAGMLPGARGGPGPDFLKELVYPPFGWSPPGRPHIEIVKGFDPDASPYIA